MAAPDLSRRLAAEALGTLLLVAAVVGSGIMAQRLTADTALALLCNTAATGAILIVLIRMFARISGAHFNPAVTLVFVLGREMTSRDGALYVAAQIAGGICGTLLAHAMFALPLVAAGLKVRSGAPIWLAEFVATFGLLGVILALRDRGEAAVAQAVGLYIAAAYWFTASTSFANPAVAIARALTPTFSGIRPVDVAPFIAAEIAGALAAWLVSRWLFHSSEDVVEKV